MAIGMCARIFTKKELELREMAKDLKEKHGCIALKMGTEVEDCSFEYIDWVSKLMEGILPIVVKIGGPEARNDIRQLTDRIGVQGLIAPMVETPYGLKKFVSALRDIVPPDRRGEMIKGINAETVTCYRNFDAILSIPEAEELNQVTIGRDDLSESIGKKVDDPEVMSMAREITRKAQAKGILVSVGGGITPSNAKRILSEIKPDKINSRHVVIGVDRSPDISESFRKALAFESALIELEVLSLNQRINSLNRRTETLKKRMAAV